MHTLRIENQPALINKLSRAVSCGSAKISKRKKIKRITNIWLACFFSQRFCLCVCVLRSMNFAPQLARALYLTALKTINTKSEREKERERDEYDASEKVERRQCFNYFSCGRRRQNKSWCTKQRFLSLSFSLVSLELILSCARQKGEN